MREFAVCIREFELQQFRQKHFVPLGDRVRIHDWNTEMVQISIFGELIWISCKEFYWHFKEEDDLGVVRSHHLEHHWDCEILWLLGLIER